MNKTWIFATMALALGTSCSKEKGIDIDDSSRQEILLGTGATINVSPASRGYGAVGGLTGANNWNGETVYVYGINNTAIADQDAADADKFYINAQAATTPDAGENKSTGPLKWVGNVHYYYNGNDLYDFYAVHVDDAVAAENLKIADGTDLAANGLSVNLKLDGTQDIMVAVPDKQKDIATAAHPEVTVDDADRLYSAWSSRRNVKPNLEFKHLLTRLNFNAKSGAETAATGENAIKITSIVIKDVVTEGTLTIIPKTGESQVFTPNVESQKEDLAIKSSTKTAEGKLEDFPVEGIAVENGKNDDFAPIGAPILLNPETEYNIIITTSQKLADNDIPQTGEVKGKIKAVSAENGIGGGEDGKFQPGTLYDINITVFDIEEISVEGTLIEWQYGGEIEINPEFPEE